MEIKDKSGYNQPISKDKTFAAILSPLLGGRAYTAVELAKHADIPIQTTTNLLAKLVRTQILAVEIQGRHEYYRLENGPIEQVKKSMTDSLSDIQSIETRKADKLPDIAYARTCYNHLAGEMGVKITSALIQQKIIQPVDQNYIVTEYGREWFSDLGINIEALELKKSSFAHKCLDWSERKHHLAGSLGNALMEYMLAKEWVRKKPNTRAIQITSLGRQELNERLKIR